jgi:ATP-dependent RNA helicase DeaD
VTTPYAGAHPALRRALDARGYVEPMPVQAAVLAPELRGRDLLVSSRTGSGKTVAVGLLLGETLLGEAEKFPAAGRPLALVIAPTRELAVQVQRELAWLLGAAGGRTITCVGGLDPRREARELKDGAHVVVGTPGRLCDHLARRSLVLNELRVLVLDEADEMLDMGFREEVEALLGAAPADRRTILLSATLPRPIVALAQRYTRDPVRIAATPPGEAHADIAYQAHVVAEREREHAVVNVLRYLDPESALVFRSTRAAVQHTAASLGERGFAVVAISGELSQPERTRALKELRDGRARVLVATDVAARGLDLPGIELVLHIDLPRDADGLRHRSGRTGRAGRKGLAVLLAAPPERSKLERIFREANIAARWLPVPSVEDIRLRDEERLAAELQALATEATEEERGAAQRLLDRADPLLLAVALGRRERQRLPAAEELPETPTAAEQAPGPRAARARHTAPADVEWFRIGLGRGRKADAKWLLPVICRRGGVTRAVIGKIVVLPGEARFEVAREAAARFAQAASRKDPRLPDAPIERCQRPPHRARPTQR